MLSVGGRVAPEPALAKSLGGFEDFEVFVNLLVHLLANHRCSHLVSKALFQGIVHNGTNLSLSTTHGYEEQLLNIFLHHIQDCRNHVFDFWLDFFWIHMQRSHHGLLKLACFNLLFIYNPGVNLRPITVFGVQDCFSSARQGGFSFLDR